MQLVTVDSAAEHLYVTRGMIHYWVRLGKLEKYPYLLTASSARARKRLYSTTRFLVDLDEAIEIQRGADKTKEEHSDKRLLTAREISTILNTTPELVRSWVREFKLTKYYKTGSTHSYYLDGDEVADALVDAGLGYRLATPPKPFDITVDSW